MKLRAGFLREIARPVRLNIGYREEPDGGMLGGKAGAQSADTAGADDGDAQLFALNGRLPKKGAILAGCVTAP